MQFLHRELGIYSVSQCVRGGVWGKVFWCELMWQLVNHRTENHLMAALLPKQIMQSFSDDKTKK